MTTAQALQKLLNAINSTCTNGEAFMLAHKLHDSLFSKEEDASIYCEKLGSGWLVLDALIDLIEKAADDFEDLAEADSMLRSFHEE